MPVRATPIFIQGNSHPAEETRLMLAGMLGSVTGSFAGGVASSDPAHGVVRATDLAVTQNGTPNMTVNVAAGGCFIRGTLSANQGAYHLWNDGTLSVAISAADLTNPRRDLIIAQVRDANYSGAVRDAQIVVVTGTPAASPADPTVPANSLVLARVAVAAAASSIVTANITDLRPVANQIGKIPTFNTSALATAAIPSPVDGQAYYLNLNTDQEGPYFFNGSQYRRPWNMPWGLVSYSFDTTNRTTTGATYVDSATWTGTPVANRYYRVTFYFGFQQTSAGAGLARVSIRDAAGTLQNFRDFYTTLANAPSAGVVEDIFITSATSTTRKGSINSPTTGTHQLTNAAQAARMFVEDLGPAGAPA